MIEKVSLVIFAFLIYEGNCVREIQLADRNVLYIRHSHLGTSIGIAKGFWDTLRSCNIIYPNRVMFEAYPQNRLPDRNVFFLQSVQPFTSCAIGFRDVGPQFSGTYELVSTVVHANDNSVSLTRQRFHLTVRESDFD